MAGRLPLPWFNLLKRDSVLKGCLRNQGLTLYKDVQRFIFRDCSKKDQTSRVEIWLGVPRFPIPNRFFRIYPRCLAEAMTAAQLRCEDQGGPWARDVQGTLWERVFLKKNRGKSCWKDPNRSSSICAIPNCVPGTKQLRGHYCKMPFWQYCPSRNF